MILNLCYHSVDDKKYLYSISPEKFAWQMKLLKRHFKIIRAKNLIDILSSGEVPKGNYATVTFDDGLKDNYLRAFPIIRELNIPITIFVVTNLIGGDIKSAITDEKLPCLKWEDIKVMQESGLVDIGLHTHTHPRLSKLTDEEIEREIKTSAEIITNKLNKPPLLAAYPKGDYNKRVVNITRKYTKGAFGENGVLLPNDKFELWSLPRVIMSKKNGGFKFPLLLNSQLWRLRRFIR